MFDLKHPTNGKPFQKAWKVATSCKELARGLDSFRCNHSKKNGVHEILQGVHTRRSELYTDKLVNIIHSLWKDSVDLRKGKGAKRSQAYLGFVAPSNTKNNQMSITGPSGPAVTVTLDAYNAIKEPINHDFNVHRPKNTSLPGIPLAGARRVFGPEIKASKDARSAKEKEFVRLVKKGTFDWSSVIEASRLRSIHKRPGSKKLHIGPVFGLCHEKGHLLDVGDIRRYFKGRYVFQGNNVRDEWLNYVIFAELSSNPATMEASHSVDAYGAFPGHATEQADAEQAYVQADIDETNAVTYVRIPKEFWPKSWIEQGFSDPVIRLRKALYGHPDSGGLWERHCEAHLEKLGFRPLAAQS